MLVDAAGRPHLLVSFGGIQQGLGIPLFEFFHSIAGLNCDKIFIRDFQQAWYHKGIDDKLRDLDAILEALRAHIAAHRYGKVVFLGNSMGGYAAILFGTLLNVDEVIAFAPQTFIDRANRLLRWDRRWSTQIAAVHAHPGSKPTYFDLKRHLKRCGHRTRIRIYYAPPYRLDRIHAERLRHAPHTTLHPMQEGGHAVVRVMRDSGALNELLRSLIGDQHGTEHQ